MKKKERNNNVIVRFFKGIFRFLDKIIITPISKAAYFIKDKLTFKSGIIDKILNKPNVLLYVSLFIALLFFFAVDKKVIGINDTKALVLKSASGFLLKVSALGFALVLDSTFFLLRPVTRLITSSAVFTDAMLIGI